MIIHKYRSIWRKLYLGVSFVSLSLMIFNTAPVLAEDDSLAGAEQFSPGSPVERDGWVDMYDPINNNLMTLPYSVIDGMAIFEADIMLGEADQIEAATATGDPDIQNGAPVTSMGGRWPDGIFYYEDFSSHGYANQIQLGMDNIAAATSIRFVETTTGPRAKFQSNGGCSSYVGRQTNSNLVPQPIELQYTGCGSIGTVMHEMFHALGVHHEQTRTDRDQYVTINPANMSCCSGNFDINYNTTPLGDYDFRSIMHYGLWAFSNGNGPTIEVKAGVNVPGGENNIGQRDAMSATDIETIQWMYTVDLGLSISTSVPEVDPGAPFQAIIDVENLGVNNTVGDIIAKDVKLTMSLNQASYVGVANGPGWSCQQVAQTVECELDQLDRNATSTLTLNLEAPSNLFNIDLTPTVSASNRDETPANDSDTATVTVKNLTDLAVDITTSKSSLQVGESLTVDLELDNSSQVDAQQLVVELTTPAALSYNAFNGTDWSCSASANVTTCNLVSLLAGDSSDLSLTFDAVDGLDDAQISVEVSSQNNDGDLTNNSKTANIDIINVTDLAVKVSASKSSVEKDDSVTINVNLNNTSNTDTSDISVVLTVDDALDYTDFSGTGWNCTSSSTTTCTLASLAQSATSKLSVRFKAVKKDSNASISVMVSSQLPDSDSSNNSASTSLEIKEADSSSGGGGGGGGGGSIDLFMLLFALLVVSYKLSSPRWVRPAVVTIKK